MPHTKEEIIKMINLDEPDYASIVAKLTPEDVPTLVELTKHENPGIATKAISCLGLMKTDKALQGLGEAVKHPDAVRRVAAANSLKHMAAMPAAVPIVEKLLEDKDIGVRKFALKTVESGKMNALKEKVRTISQREENATLKNLGENVLKNLR